MCGKKKLRRGKIKRISYCYLKSNFLAFVQRVMLSANRPTEEKSLAELLDRVSQKWNLTFNTDPLIRAFISSETTSGCIRSTRVETPLPDLDSFPPVLGLLQIWNEKKTKATKTVTIPLCYPPKFKSGWQNVKE